MEQAQVVAHNILHPESLQVHDSIPYVWTDQYDWKVQLLGTCNAGEPVVIGDPIQTGKGAAIYTAEDGRLAGAITINLAALQIRARRIMAQDGDAGELLDFAATRGLLPGPQLAR